MVVKKRKEIKPIAANGYLKEYRQLSVAQRRRVRKRRLARGWSREEASK